MNLTRGSACPTLNSKPEDSSKKLTVFREWLACKPDTIESPETERGPESKYRRLTDTREINAANNKRPNTVSCLTMTLLPNATTPCYPIRLQKTVSTPLRIPPSSTPQKNDPSSRARKTAITHTIRCEMSRSYLPLSISSQ